MPDELALLKTAIAADNVAEVNKCVSARPQLLNARLDESGRSALHLAAQHNARRVAELLLTTGTDFYARDTNGQLPLDLPPGEEMNETRKWLRGINKARNEFLGAVHNQKIDEVKTLLAADKSLANARDIGDGWSGVMTACHFGNEELLRVLIAAGAKIDSTDFNNGQDSVFICAAKGQVGCLRVLLEAGADVKATWKINYGSLPMQMNALHVASWKGHGEVVRLLLASKADANERSKSYAIFSPLHFAATEGHTEIVKQLLAAGADRSARDGRRVITALEMAEAGKHEETAAVLRGQ
jgi:ankyrin repeat protein